jgi:hypothetical protein
LLFCRNFPSCNCFDYLYGLIFHLHPPYHITSRIKLIVLQVVNCLCFDYLVIALITCNCYFFNNRSAMVSKHSELMKRQAQARYDRFASPSSHTAPPPSHRPSSTALLLPLHPVTHMWRSRRCHLLLRHTWATPPRPPQDTTTSALTSER